MRAAEMQRIIAHFSHSSAVLLSCRRTEDLIGSWLPPLNRNPEPALWRMTLPSVYPVAPHAPFLTTMLLLQAEWEEKGTSLNAWSGSFHGGIFLKLFDWLELFFFLFFSRSCKAVRRRRSGVSPASIMHEAVFVFAVVTHFHLLDTNDLIGSVTKPTENP